MARGDCCASEGRLDGDHGGVGVEDERLVYPAAIDDEEGGDEGVCLGGVEVSHGLDGGEVGEEAGQEGDEAIERPLDDPVRCSLISSCCRRSHTGSNIWSHDGVDIDVGGGIQEAEAKAAVSELPILHPVVAIADLGKNRLTLFIQLGCDEVIIEVQRPIDLGTALALVAPAEAAEHLVALAVAPAARVCDFGGGSGRHVLRSLRQ